MVSLHVIKSNENLRWLQKKLISQDNHVFTNFILPALFRCAEGHDLHYAINISTYIHYIERMTL